MADQAYFEDDNGKGDFYQCLQATAAGESPATAPGKWSKIQIPKQWRKVLARFTYANLLEADGQTEKAFAIRTAAENMEHNGLEVLIRDEANRDSYRTRPQVQVPEDPLSRNKTLFSRECYAGVDPIP